MNDLMLDISNITGRGRRAEPAEILSVRELTREDVTALQSLPRGSEPAPLVRISERHHSLARLLAMGTENHHAARLVGYSESRLSILLSDPSFQNLVESYRATVDQSFAEVADRAAGLSKDAILELQTRLEDTPDDFTNALLLDIAKTMMDRTGHGPSTNVNTNINLTLGDKLKAARERAREAMIDVTPDE